jgi:hypothetical protein
VRYRLASLLAVAVCAVLAGATTFAAIGDRATDLDEAARHRLGFVGRIPAGSTVWRFLIRIDAQVLQAVLTGWLAALPPADPTSPGAQGQGGHRGGRQAAARGAAAGWSAGAPALGIRHRHRRRPGPGRHRGEVERDPRLHPAAEPDPRPTRLARWHQVWLEYAG